MSSKANKVLLTSRTDIPIEALSKAPSCPSAYLWNPTAFLLKKYLHKTGKMGGADVLDAGCGNGAFCRYLQRVEPKINLSGFDISKSGVAIAKKEVSGGTFLELSGYSDLKAAFGKKFDAIVSLEVIEHIYNPDAFLESLHEALSVGGIMILSTPYHGYLKNVVLALLGKFDSHFTALWPGGHIKFWSRGTLEAILSKHHFEILEFKGTGRIPYLWKSMIIAAKKK